VSSRKRRSQTHTYTQCYQVESLKIPYEDFELVAPKVTHLNGVYLRGLTLQNLTKYIACRKFGCALPLVHKFIEKFSAAVYRHIRLLSLFRALSRAAVRSDYLSIRTTSIAADSCAMNKREEE